jgi:hypothetical protein
MAAIASALSTESKPSMIMSERMIGRAWMISGIDGMAKSGVAGSRAFHLALKAC